MPRRVSGLNGRSALRTAPWSPPLRPAPIEVWAVEDDRAQVTWGWLDPGTVRLRARREGERSLLAEVSVAHVGGAGAVDVYPLPPDTALEIEVVAAEQTRTLRTRTMAPPPGAELARFATVSDLHIGARRWGFLKTMTEPDSLRGPTGEPYATRCARRAIEDAVAWGAQHLVIKGDAAEHRNPQHFAALGALLDEFAGLPMTLIPGNHDVDYRQSDIDLPLLGARRLGYEHEVTTVDLAGCRIVAFNSTLPGQNHGSVAPHHAAVADAAAGAPHQVFATCHHHLQRSERLRHWPPGVPAHEGRALARDLARTPRPVLFSAGHSHRNRRWRLEGLAFTEVASTKDWPGVWAGYVVHEGGIRQVVRRIPATDTVDWHDYSRGAVLGLWGPWSAGTLDQRCASFDAGTPTV